MLIKTSVFFIQKQQKTAEHSKSFKSSLNIIFSSSRKLYESYKLHELFLYFQDVLSLKSEDKANLPLDNPNLPLDNPILPLDNPILPLSNPILPLDNLILPLDNPNLPLSNPILPV